MLLLLLGVLLIFLGLMVLLWPRGDEKDLKEKIEENGDEEELGKDKPATSIKGGGVIMMIMAFAVMVLWLLAAKQLSR